MSSENPRAQVPASAPKTWVNEKVDVDGDRRWAVVDADTGEFLGVFFYKDAELTEDMVELNMWCVRRPPKSFYPSQADIQVAELQHKLSVADEKVRIDLLREASMMVSAGKYESIMDAMHAVADAWAWLSGGEKK